MYFIEYSLPAMLTLFRFNKYSQIAARALRNSLKEGERVKAERRGMTALRYQHWENGQGGEQVRSPLRCPRPRRDLIAHCSDVAGLPRPARGRRREEARCMSLS